MLHNECCHVSSVNVGCGPAEERVLLTGLHAVADIFCECCKTTLGWKYVSFFFLFNLMEMLHKYLICDESHWNRDIASSPNSIIDVCLNVTPFLKTCSADSWSIHIDFLKTYIWSCPHRYWCQKFYHCQSVCLYICILLHLHDLNLISSFFIMSYIVSALLKAGHLCPMDTFILLFHIWWITGLDFCLSFCFTQMICIPAKFWKSRWRISNVDPILQWISV